MPDPRDAGGEPDCLLPGPERRLPLGGPGRRALLGSDVDPRFVGEGLEVVDLGFSSFPGHIGLNAAPFDDLSYHCRCYRKLVAFVGA